MRRQSKKKNDIHKSDNTESILGKRNTRDNIEQPLVRLNKYLSNAGVCSRREADRLIEEGLIKVNGQVVTALGTKVKMEDEVLYQDKKVVFEKPVYLLLNKPKGYITTVKDPQERKTVIHLVRSACKERIYPVGRLDKETTGLLLLTNDGDLTKKLTHPKFGVKKIYHVILERNVTKFELEKLVTGIDLEDGEVKADVVNYVGDGKDKKQIGIELHSGKNRVIRRMMENLGHNIIKLDRVFFAGLTKRNIPRGKYRFLESREIEMLKRLG